ncbi:hypothetical protein HAQ04_00195 [Pseudomonas sp. C2L11]|uniref:Glycosyltransferase RgtA/B/C/D-like domain-containing protein n=2 Tax=Pseudomonas typographi TaxID=2715964 RepID=A0ABR7YVV6_9PSED|nr:hypothetical protein [Pseudomonas typographi]MBD1597295.1 hypothetical protein [Pseudomonas typographi]
MANGMGRCARPLARRLQPVPLAFFGSVFLSFVAIMGVVTVGRDGAFYLDIAQQVIDHDASAAWGVFDWPWYSLLLAGTHRVLRLPLEACAYLWSTLFLAGTCALVVDGVRQRVRQAAYWACLVVLAMPAVNQFRGDIIRESGFWFFCVLALWLAMRWQKHGGWWLAGSIYLAIALASLFRLEALVLVLAMVLWRLPDVIEPRQRRLLLQMLWAPAAAALMGGLLVLALGDVPVRRWEYYVELVRPAAMFGAFHQLSEQFAASLINKYSANEAGRIIFIGLSGSLLIKCIGLMGPFALAFLSPRPWYAFKVYWRDFRVAAITGLLYLCILMLFFIRMQFVNGRYLSFLILLAVPLLAVAMSMFASHYPRLGKALIGLGVLVMIGNVISLSAQKTHYVEAGHWVAGHTPREASIYYQDGRIAYYAGRGYKVDEATPEAVMNTDQAQGYQYFVIEASGNEPWLRAWLVEHQQKVLAHFANRKGDAVVVIGH